LTDIYHITHVDHLASIIECGGLYCDKDAEGKGVTSRSIAYQRIKERRARTRIPIAPGGFLCDYVPFYFAPRSPMLYANFRGFAGSDGQGSILHLVASAEAVRSAHLRFVFTDGHAVMSVTKFYSDLPRLDAIDWPVMLSTYWNDTLADPDRKRRRQAEFLVHSFLPWHHVGKIGACTRQLADQARELVEDCEHKPEVVVRRAWYY
jgi:hypothetical protein